MISKILIRVFPILIVVLFIAFIEWRAWRLNVTSEIIFSAPKDTCDPDDTVCRQCPFFREKVIEMNRCVRNILDRRISNSDVGYVVNSIPYAIKKCNLKWIISQRVLQMIKLKKTEFVLTSTNTRSALTALILGADDDFEMEKQLADNMTRVEFYGTNFDSPEESAHFNSRLNGTQIEDKITLTNEIKTDQKDANNKTLLPKAFFQKYFPRRPLDILFIHSNDTTPEFVDQLMGKGLNGIEHPVCQLNIEVPLPSNLGSARQLVQWFKQLNTKIKPLERQYLIGYATIVINKSEMRLRFFAINVGKAVCVAKFLNHSECRALIGSEFDE